MVELHVGNYKKATYHAVYAVTVACAQALAKIDKGVCYYAVKEDRGDSGVWLIVVSEKALTLLDRSVNACIECYSIAV